MQRPANVTGVKVVEWKKGGRKFAVPSVAHAAWQTPSGRHGVVLANWTTQSHAVVLSDARLGKSAMVHVCAKKMEASRVAAAQDGFHIALPPLACVLVANEERAQ